MSFPDAVILQYRTYSPYATPLYPLFSKSLTVPSIWSVARSPFLVPRIRPNVIWLDARFATSIGCMMILLSFTSVRIPSFENSTTQIWNHRTLLWRSLHDLWKLLLRAFRREAFMYNVPSPLTSKNLMSAGWTEEPIETNSEVFPSAASQAVWDKNRSALYAYNICQAIIIHVCKEQTMWSNLRILTAGDVIPVRVTVCDPRTIRGHTGFCMQFWALYNLAKHGHHHNITGLLLLIPHEHEQSETPRDRQKSSWSTSLRP